MKVLQEISVPQESVNDDMLLVVAMPFANGAKVVDRDIVLELESSKTTFTIESETDGYIEYLCKDGDEVAVNTVVIKIYDQAPQQLAKEETITVSVASNGNGQHIVKPDTPLEVKQFEETLFSAAAERLIAEKGVALAQFTGRDFVSLRDVQEALGIVPPSTKAQNAAVVTTPPQSQAIPLPKADLSGVSIEPLTSIKKKEIQYLSSVQSAGLNSQVELFVETRGILDFVRPHFTVIKDSFLPLIIYEAGRLLKQYPDFNAYFSADGIAYYEQANVGIAMDMGKGLKVLKIAEVDKLSLQECENQILALSEAYLEDKIKPAQLSNITFTITDLSAEGISSFSPLINMKNSAILGVSAIDPKLERFALTLTFDHRISVGKDAANFLTQLKTRLESYRSPSVPGNYYEPSKVSCHKCMKKLSQEIGGMGFLKTVRQDGKEVFTCQSCLLGH